MNPSTAFGQVLSDELIRCGLRDIVLAPGSRSTPLAMAFAGLERAGRIRLHVRLDERSAAFTALGLAKAGRRPAAVLCTSGTAAANFYPAVIEADESCVPLLVLTADRPPDLRSTGANQTIDQVKLYGTAVRWFFDVGVPERRSGAGGYWRSVACRAFALAAGTAGGLAGPVHLNLPLREPLVPSGGPDWPEPLDGRPAGEPWTRFSSGSPAASADGLVLPWTERGLVVCGDGDYDALPLLRLAERAGWPVLAEPSCGARCGPNALSAYEYLLAAGEFMAAHRPDVVISAGRPGLSRPQSALLAGVARHVVIAQGPGRWADQARNATDVAASVSVSGAPSLASMPAPAPAPVPAPAPSRVGSPGGWLSAWLAADAAARRAADEILDATPAVSEPRLARDLVAALPAGALLWTGNSMPVRDTDSHMPARCDIRILANRGTSGIDGSTSSAAGAALAHGGPAFALIGDLALVHDAPGLAIAPGEPRPDLCLIVVNNDGGGIFSMLEQASFDDVFERAFGTPHGTDVERLAAAFGIPYTLLKQPEDLVTAISGTGLRIVEARTDRAEQAALRTRLRQAATAAASAASATSH